MQQQRCVFLYTLSRLNNLCSNCDLLSQFCNLSISLTSVWTALFTKVFQQGKATSEEVLKGWNGFVWQNHLDRSNKTTCSSCPTCTGKWHLCTYLPSFIPTVTKLKKLPSDRQHDTKLVPDHLWVLQFPIRRPQNNPSGWRKRKIVNYEGGCPLEATVYQCYKFCAFLLYNAWYTVRKARRSTFY